MVDIESEGGAERRPRRDRERTRTAILEVAAKLLAQDGPEGLSVSQVAQHAGVNRGTAYHHFQTREQLLKETTAWISESLCREVFGDIEETPELVSRVRRNPRETSERLARFVMDNPAFGRAWLFEVLSSSEPSDDPFWRLYRAHVESFVQSERAQPGIDGEVHAMLMVVGIFMWPVWTRAEEKSPAVRRKLAKRFVNETLRHSMYGILRRDQFQSLDEMALVSDESGQEVDAPETIDSSRE